MFPASRQVCVEECVLQCVCGVVGVVEGAVGDGPEAFLVASDEGGEGVEVAVDVGGEQVVVAACVGGSPWHGLRVVQGRVGYVGLRCGLWRDSGVGMVAAPVTLGERLWSVGGVDSSASEVDRRGATVSRVRPDGCHRVLVGRRRCSWWRVRRSPSCSSGRNGGVRSRRFYGAS